MSHQVTTVAPETPVRTAAALLASRGFTAVPVVDADRRLVGIVTEADLIVARINAEISRRPPWDEQHSVREVMTPEPLTARPDDDISAVVAEMLDARVRSMPVVEHGQLVGIVSRRDVLRLVAGGELIPAAEWRRRETPASQEHGRGGEMIPPSSRPGSV
jgi:CBS domain-containing protein